MKKFSPLVIMISLSIGFTFSLVAIRIFLTHEWQYANYFWNTFLAVLPMFFAFRLNVRKKPDLGAAILLMLWLLFFPNAPYLVTDLIHFKPEPHYSKWADILLVTSASWNGLLIGVISLMKAEGFVGIHFSKTVVHLFNLVSIFLCGYGIYLGRFLRYNSWDIFISPVSLFYDLARTVVLPHHYLGTWMFTVLFGLMFGIFYFTIKQLAGGKNE